MNKLLVSIIGPTAIGKTSLSLVLAKHFKTHIISADSRQFYKEMAIGTAVPSPDELDVATHHFIQHKSIHETYTVGDFEREAIARIETLFKTHPVVIMVGGSGLYVKAVTHGLDYFPEIKPNIRQELNLKLEQLGIESLQADLKQLDPLSYQTIALDNPQRVIRALEICVGSGKPYSSYLSNTSKSRPFKTVSIGLDAPRDIIYNRINDRVDHMLENGLLDEVKDLLDHKALNALNTVGYKELFQYLEGSLTLDLAVEEIKKNTRRFAKRQLTWFRKDKSVHWFDYHTDPKVIIATIEKHLEASNKKSSI